MNNVQLTSAGGAARNSQKGKLKSFSFNSRDNLVSTFARVDSLTQNDVGMNIVLIHSAINSLA